ncbi:alpha/beta hydrolase [Pseudonocardia nematodicida]|uniref:Alpha/beta hydrolase n=1 Tax=Pseudonocardia nematodicida TaxID=1206997 RepID=A0ABV1K3V8_9PSEU
MTPREPRGRVAVLARGLLGAVAVVVAAWIGIADAGTLVAGHPALPVLLAVVGLCGLVLLLRSARPVRPGRLRTTWRVAGGVVLALAVALVVWLRPYPADAGGLAATASSAQVEVVHGATAWELRPVGAGTGTGVVFHPGGLVDPRAYLPLLRPLAEQGVVVIVPDPPLGLAIIDPGATARAVGSVPEVRTWAVGGHSLGGVVAAMGLDVPGVRGLFLWASYPSGSVADAGVAGLSVYGERDALAAPEAIEESRPQLPPDTRFVEVPGGTHAFFGDYGPQAGDGEPGTDRGTAQRLIVAETAEFVRSLQPG